MRKGLGEIDARNIVDVREAEGVVAGERIVALGRTLDDDGADRVAKRLHIGTDLGHAVRQGLQHRRRGGAGIGGFEVCERLACIPGDADAAGRADGDAAGIRHLFQQDDRSPLLRRLDRGDAAGEAEADDDDIRVAHLRRLAPRDRRGATFGFEDGGRKASG